jgi:predicted alpha/beta superfamily hydrolase
MNASYQTSPNLQERINTLLISVLLCVSFFVSGNAQMKDASTVQPQVEIAGTQLLKIPSTICNQEYVLYINLPRGYDDTTKMFPVLFLVDAQWDFPLVQAIFGEQYYDGFIPGIVIVGITWGGKNPDYDKLRARDLTPTDISHTGQFGNAPNFLAFIKKELIPFVESKYRVKKDDRTLVGSSFGGLFTLYALFHESETFNRYILTSPSLGWDDGITYTYEKKYAEKKTDLPVRIFMAIGEYEGVSDFQKFVDHMKGRNYKNLELRTKVLEGMGHSGGKAEGYTRGLQSVFSRTSISVSPAILDQYIGAYEINPQFRIKLIRENEHLVAVAPDDTKIIAYAETEKDFYVKGQYLLVHFVKDKTGKVTGFQMERYEGESFIKKIE